MSAICGGVISVSKSIRDMKRHGVWANAMAFVMPDKQFDKYQKLKQQGKHAEAERLFDKYAVSGV